MQKYQNCWARDGEVSVKLREILLLRRLRDFASFIWQSFLITNTDLGRELGPGNIQRVVPVRDTVETMNWCQISSRRL